MPALFAADPPSRKACADGALLRLDIHWIRSSKGLTNSANRDTSLSLLQLIQHPTPGCAALHRALRTPSTLIGESPADVIKAALNQLAVDVSPCAISKSRGHQSESVPFGDAFEILNTGWEKLSWIRWAVHKQTRYILARVVQTGAGMDLLAGAGSFKGALSGGKRVGAVTENETGVEQARRTATQSRSASFLSPPKK